YGRLAQKVSTLSTATTGYFMRKGVMNNQSSIIDNFRRVTKDTKVVQFLYGEDGLDTRSLEKVSFRTVCLSDKELRDSTWIDVSPIEGSSSDRALAKTAVEKAYLKIQSDRDLFRTIFSRLEKINFSQFFTFDIPMPVNIHRIVTKTQLIGRINRVSLDPDIEKERVENLTCKLLHQRIERVDTFCANLPYTLINEIQE
ncbi:30377_t:CDS:1, partial [Racocetra persica]